MHGRWWTRATVFLSCQSGESVSEKPNSRFMGTKFKLKFATKVFGKKKSAGAKGLALDKIVPTIESSDLSNAESVHEGEVWSVIQLFELKLIRWEKWEVSKSGECVEDWYHLEHEFLRLVRRQVKFVREWSWSFWCNWGMREWRKAKKLKNKNEVIGWDLSLVRSWEKWERESACGSQWYFQQWEHLALC